MVRYAERVSVPEGAFGEEIYEQIRVLTPGRYTVYRYRDADEQTNRAAGWYVVEGGTTSLDEVPLATVYSNRIATLVSKPPMVEVAELNIAYAQRFCDYHHSIHVGAQPILCLKGFDPENNSDLGLSVNTAVLLPPDGDAMYVEPTSDAYDAQLKCLQTLEEQIRSLGVSVLAKQNVTNAAAEAKRLDRIDSDSIMALVSEDLARTVADLSAWLVNTQASNPQRQSPFRRTSPTGCWTATRSLRCCSCKCRTKFRRNFSFASSRKAKSFRPMWKLTRKLL